MKTYLRMLRYLRPYWKLIVLNGLCVITYAVLSGVSVLSVSPFVRILFQDADRPTVTAPQAANAPGSLSSQIGSRTNPLLRE